MRGGYPINSAELSRRLLGREHVPDDYFVRGQVRRLLQKFGCPRESGGYRPPYLVDEDMARRVRGRARAPAALIPAGKKLALPIRFRAK